MENKSILDYYNNIYQSENVEKKFIKNDKFFS
jgi:hypothetical protein